MEPADLTLQVLREIRDETKKTNQRIEQMNSQFNERFERMDHRFERMDQRFEVVETVLRDLAQQMVTLSRGVKSALEVRANTESRLEDLERRMTAVESRDGH